METSLNITKKIFVDTFFLKFSQAYKKSFVETCKIDHKKNFSHPIHKAGLFGCSVKKRDTKIYIFSGQLVTNPIK